MSAKQKYSYSSVDCPSWSKSFFSIQTFETKHLIATNDVFSRSIMTGSYNNFFHIFDRSDKTDICLEASREFSKPRQILKPRRVTVTGKRKKDDITVECLDFSHKILHTAWHPQENIIAVAATNNLYLFQEAQT